MHNYSEVHSIYSRNKEVFSDNIVVIHFNKCNNDPIYMTFYPILNFATVLHVIIFSNKINITIQNESNFCSFFIQMKPRPLSTIMK